MSDPDDTGQLSLIEAAAEIGKWASVCVHFRSDHGTCDEGRIGGHNVGRSPPPPSLAPVDLRRCRDMPKPLARNNVEDLRVPLCGTNRAQGSFTRSADGVADTDERRP
ncbi:hypothetical protein MTO96_020560 [Rhipicephalus appendiculatus]